MASIRELRGRIRSIASIRQITRAMEMVASTKLRRFQEKAVASRPYAQEIAGLVSRLASMLGDSVEGRPLFRRGENEGVAVLLVSSDRGLCGAYNSNVFRKLELWLAEKNFGTVTWYVYGRKGYQYLQRRGREVEHLLVEPALEQVDYRAAARTARLVTDAFLAGRFREVFIFYTAFESVVRYVPTAAQLLPVEKSAIEAGKAAPDVILEPDAETIFDRLVPRYLETRIYNALLEALTSEYASRRVSMKAATDAARDMGKVLKGIYNRKRQENITKELLDIVGGVEALR
ncbi:MAG TPA: ATP synthase F1 subunit gamma [Planctomycetota bacterium]|jgi:F-type H+-transporting ATPase subunit gamma|nr:ATP synthase F1 subunit gamma [Planctomycetota bacterium]